MTPGDVGGPALRNPPPAGTSLPRGDTGRLDRETGEALEELRETTRLFESVFYEELFKAMRATVPEGGFVEGGTGEDLFTPLLDRHVAEAAVERREGTLAELLYRRFASAVAGRGATTEDAP